MPKTYHWMSNYTGELSSFLGIFENLWWSLRHIERGCGFDWFKYAISWRFSRSGY